MSVDSCYCIAVGTGSNFVVEDIITITINTAFGSIEIIGRIKKISTRDGIFTFFVVFEKQIDNEISVLLRKIDLNGSLVNKRKEKRILCSQSTLEKLRLNPMIKVEYKGAFFNGYLKDISFSAIRILIDFLLFGEQNDNFLLHLAFNDPIENILFKSKVIRKEVFRVENRSFAMIIFDLKGNERYKERLLEYMKKYEKDYMINI
jgi:hypothetical protein